jgi:hypothetical protein
MDSTRCYVIYCMCCPSSQMNLQLEGGEASMYLTDFLVSLMASVAANYVCKWLEWHDKDS